MRVEYTKWDGRRHWHFDLDHLGEDDHGLWLAARKGCRLQRGDEPPIVEQKGSVCLVPRAGDWIAYFIASGDVEIYIDVTNTPQRSDEKIEAIDMDLDVVRWRDGRVLIDDEDEFEEHRELFGYPPEAVEAARATTSLLVGHVTSRAEPFDLAAAHWLRQL